MLPSQRIQLPLLPTPLNQTAFLVCFCFALHLQSELWSKDSEAKAASRSCTTERTVPEVRWWLCFGLFFLFVIHNGQCSSFYVLQSSRQEEMKNVSTYFFCLFLSGVGKSRSSQRTDQRAGKCQVLYITCPIYWYATGFHYLEQFSMK